MEVGQGTKEKEHHLSFLSSEAVRQSKFQRVCLQLVDSSVTLAWFEAT
jgi:hypothetical protein